MIKPFVRTAIALSLLSAAAVADAQHRIETYAGGGPDDVAAIAAAIGIPTAITIDASGNTFVTSQNSRVFKIDAGGHLTVFAGTGIGGFGGDGGPARDATLFAPTGVAVDGGGNVYICDWGNQRIRRVDAVTLEITTVAGGGADTADGVPAATSALAGPNGIAIDASGQIYIAETGANRIRKIDATGTIATIATGPISFPMAVAVDGAGNVFVADTSNGRVRRVDAVSGDVSTVAVASFPSAVAAAGGILFIAEQGGARVLQVAGGITTTLAGTGVAGFSGDGASATAANLSHGILGLAADFSGNVFIADSYNRRVRRVDAASGIINTVAGNGELAFSGDGEAARKSSLTVYGLAVDGAGNVYFPDAGRIRRITAATGAINSLAGSEGIAVEGRGIAADGAGGWLVADFAGNRVNRIDSSGTITTVAGTGASGYSGDGSAATSARLNGPTAVAVDPAGNIFIADTFNHRVRKIDSAGTIITVAGNGTTGLAGPTFAIHVDGVAATTTRVWNPTGLALRGGNLYIAEQFGHRVRVVDSSGIINTFAGGGIGGDGGPASNAALGRPTNLTFDALGSLYITETELNSSRVRRVDVSGTIDTVAGTGAMGFSGDGGPATLATFALLSPWGVAVDSLGNMLLGDTNNNRIRRVTNQAPVADAGDDVIANPNVPFTLSGQRSFDSDGDTLSYDWVDEFGSSVGSTRDVTDQKPAGTHTYTLTVSDGFTSDTDTVVVTMNPIVLVNVFGAGSGIVTSADGGISCASGTGLDCAEGYAAGTNVTLTATPEQWSVFGGWDGACAAFGSNLSCSITVDANALVRATFNVQTFNLTVTNASGGTVTSNVGGINCGVACSAVLVATTPVDLTATPAPGYRFDGWSGACTGTGLCSLTMTADLSVTPSFSSIALTQLVISPSSATIGVGQMQPFKATGTFTAGSARLVSPVSALEGGDNYTCALLMNGTVQCWGGFAALTPLSPVPVTMAGLSEVVSLGAGTSQACAVLANGSVQCLGYGNLGDGVTTLSTTPVTVSGISTATAVVVGAGGAHACVLLANGSIQCWGTGGLLGDGTDVTSLTPVPVVGITNAVAISSEGGLHTCALLADRTIRCWGASPLGQLGDAGGWGSYSPLTITGIADATAVAAGSSHTCAIVGSGAVKCWGGNFYGQLGNGTMGDPSYSPVDVLGITNAVAIATGDFHSCALLADGSVKCWGEAFANGSASRSGTPIPIAGIGDATALGTGANHSCAMLVSGGIKCWGSGGAGELGDGNSQWSSTPVTVAGITTGLSVVWTSSTAAAPIDAHGRAIGASSGTTTIGIAAAGASAAATLTVNNTPAGGNVSVAPIDASSGSAPVTLTFTSVTQTGVTTLTMGSGGPAPPAGFQLGTPPVYYELTTTAVFAGSITICIDYTGITFTGPPALFHFESGAWVNRTTSVDTVNEIVCGSVTSLSPFALFRPDAAPVIREVRPSLRELWPANHRMVAVTMRVDAIDDSGTAPLCRVVAVTSSEPANGSGDGDTSPDWIITDDLTVLLRAERSGRASGRIYTIGVRCVDGAGNAATASAIVRVPHDRR